MIFTVSSAKVQDVLLCFNIHNMKNAVIVCAIPFKVSSAVIMRDANGNNIYLRRYSERAEIKCPVCLRYMTTCIRTPCGHLYCSDCIQRILMTERIICPVCNQQFTPNSLTKVHLT